MESTGAPPFWSGRFIAHLNSAQVLQRSLAQARRQEIQRFEGNSGPNCRCGTGLLCRMVGPERPKLARRLQRAAVRGMLQVRREFKIEILK